jgi:segregation and condensation protein A
MAVDVSTSVYEGPFDLLLHLILKEQVDIYEVSLSRIVDAYLQEVERLQALDLDVATEFLLIASTLVELKARRLLPGREDIDLDDELALWEERDLLLARLLECKTFKDVAGVFARLADDADRSFPRGAGADERFEGLMPDLLEGVSPLRLQRAYLRAVTPKVVPRIDLFHVAPVKASVSDALVELLDAHQWAGRADRGHRALPRPARAVQAGLRRARTDRAVRRRRGRVDGYRHRRAGLVTHR